MHMITIEHIAIWVKDLDGMKIFYEKYFGAVAGQQYHNPAKGFYSYFMRFGDGCRLELMQMPTIPESLDNPASQFTGLIHFAVSVGSRTRVDALTERLREDGYTIAGEPRTTGDGYYESVVFDPEGNRVEITA